MFFFQLTWADFVFAGAVEYMTFVSGTDFLGKYPGLKNVFDNATASPKVKEWMSKRPKTDL